MNLSISWKQNIKLKNKKNKSLTVGAEYVYLREWIPKTVECVDSESNLFDCKLLWPQHHQGMLGEICCTHGFIVLIFDVKCVRLETGFIMFSKIFIDRMKTNTSSIAVECS